MNITASSVDSELACIAWRLVILSGMARAWMYGSVNRFSSVHQYRRYLDSTPQLAAVLTASSWSSVPSRSRSASSHMTVAMSSVRFSFSRYRLVEIKCIQSSMGIPKVVVAASPHDGGSGPTTASNSAATKDRMTRIGALIRFSPMRRRKLRVLASESCERSTEFGSPASSSWNEISCE